MEYYAHSVEGKTKEEWQLLKRCQKLLVGMSFIDRIKFIQE